MNPDSFQQAWQSQPGQKMDAAMIVEDLKLRQRQFSATLFRRDMTEVGISFFMLPVWFALGYCLKLPWTWYLTVPVLCWLGGFMLRELMRRRRTERNAAESFRQRVEHSLDEVEHQIRLLRSVFWWSLLPTFIALLPFFAQVAWESRFDLGWLGVILFFAMTTGLTAIVFAGIYLVNQRAVRSTLEPRRRELDELLQTLSDDPG